MLSLLEVSRQYVYSVKGKHVGRVTDVLFAPGTTAVTGFVVSRPRLLFLIDRNDRYLALDRTRISADGVVVVDPKAAWDGSAARRLGHSWDDTVIWVGMPVSTESGVKLGSVRDGLFDEKTGAISAIGLTGGLTADAAVGVRDLPASVVLGFDGQAVRVKDEAIAFEPSGGAAAAAGRSTAVAKKAAIDAAAKAAVYGKAAVKVAGQSEVGKRAAGWLIDGPGLVKAFREADPAYLAGVVLMAVLTYLFRAWRWGYLLAPLARVPLMRLFSITNVGFATGLVIPRAGEVVRPYLVARHHGLKTSAAFASIILERLFDLITVLTLFAAYLYVLPLPAAQTEAPGRALQASGALAGAGALGALVVLLFLTYRRESALALADRMLAWLPARIGGALGRGLHSFTLGLGVLRASPGHLLAIGLQSVLVWFVIALGIHLNNRAFGVDLPFHSTFFMLGFLTVGVAVPTPGMVGGFHAFYKIALLHFAFASDPAAATATAAAAALSCHALSNLPVLVLGLVFLGREGLSWGGVSRLAEERPAAVPESPEPARSA